MLRRTKTATLTRIGVRETDFVVVLMVVVQVFFGVVIVRVREVPIVVFAIVVERDVVEVVALVVAVVIETVSVEVVDFVVILAIPGTILKVLNESESKLSKPSSDAD